MRLAKNRSVLASRPGTVSPSPELRADGSFRDGIVTKMDVVETCQRRRNFTFPERCAQRKRDCLGRLIPT